MSQMAPPSSFRIVLVSLFLHLPLIASAVAAAPQPNHGGASVTYPVYKDARGTQLYYTTLQIGTPPTTANFTLTLASQLLWYICQIDGFKSTTYRLLPCQTRKCRIEAKGINCYSCDEPVARPGCTNDTCAAMTFNPFDGVKTAEPIYTDVLQVPSRSYSAVRNFPFQCAGYAMLYLSGLPKGNKGMLGLALSNVSLPAAVASGLKLPNTFALCLPSDIDAGKLLVGGGPYDTPGTTLMQTPIVVNPYSTAPIHGSREESYEYFINVTSIKVGGVRVKLNSTLLSFYNYGHGGTKLSVVAPYTILHRGIYEPLVDAFTKAATGMKMQRAPPVGNLSVCFSSASIARDGDDQPVVPAIDLVLQSDDVYLRMEGSNLMVQVSETVSCLGVVDGGDEPRTAVVIGGRQMEDRLVEFDLSSMQLRFTSSSLRRQNSTCSRSF
uniref:Peptidase A1 domain-containing protein n=1 Tax=Kalanchoe fedtschenkoi TaxID=63787 RepID=A0A7N0V5J1_KALFE